MCCCEGSCGKCSGWLKALLGILMLINLFVWPKWTGVDGWLAFAAVLLVLCGIIFSFTGSCTCATPAPAKKKR